MMGIRDIEVKELRHVFKHACKVQWSSNHIESFVSHYHGGGGFNPRGSVI